MNNVKKSIFVILIANLSLIPAVFLASLYASLISQGLNARILYSFFTLYYTFIHLVTIIILLSIYNFYAVKAIANLNRAYILELIFSFGIMIYAFLNKTNYGDRLFLIILMMFVLVIASFKYKYLFQITTDR